MPDEYKYFRNYDDNIYRVCINQDKEALYPIYNSEGCIGHIMMWWNGHPISNLKENTYHDPREFVRDLVSQYPPEGWSEDSDVFSLSFDDTCKLLGKMDVAILPLYIYDHSDMVVSTSKFSCPWDSGFAGWIYATKEDINRVGLTLPLDCGSLDEYDWRVDAAMYLESEVEQYNMYLAGQCYEYTVEKLCTDSTFGPSWEFVETCGGFFSDKYGDDLMQEIVCEALGCFELYDSLEILQGVA